MDMHLLKDILIILALSVVVLFVCHRLRLPSVIGFLTTGIVAGPYGPGLVRETERVELLAEMGVILLLFTIGLEFSLRGLARIRRSVLLGGALQVSLTGLAGFLIADQVGVELGPAIFIGFLVSLSSTAIVMRLIQDRAEVDTPHGRISLGILIFQDLVIVPMMLVTPLLAAGSLGALGPLLLAKGQAALLVGVVLTAAVWLVPLLLHQIVRTRSRELFLLTIVTLCATVAWLTSNLGLSLALGAFLAGLIISESEYAQQALGDVLPFRDVFASFFFISVGMLLDLDFVARNLATVLALALGVVLLKALLAGGATFLLGFPLRTAVLVGLGLSQVGEFSFVLARTGVQEGLLSGQAYQLFLAVAILTMAATPLLVMVAPRVAGQLLKLPLPRRLRDGWFATPEAARTVLEDHLIIVGFGINGRNVSRAARAAGVPYVILEMNPDTVRSRQAEGEPIHFGDATREAVLAHVGIARARVLVVAISDPAATQAVVALARRLNPGVHLIARTRFVGEVPALYDLGADEVIPEEFETSVEIFTRVLRRYLVPEEDIDRLIGEVRAEGYEMLRGRAPEPSSLAALRVALSDQEIAVLRIAPHSPMAGRTLGELDMRREYGVTLLAARRGATFLANPAGDLELQPEDVVVVIGPPERLQALRAACRCALLDPPKDPPEAA